LNSAYCGAATGVSRCRSETIWNVGGKRAIVNGLEGGVLNDCLYISIIIVLNLLAFPRFVIPSKGHEHEYFHTVPLGRASGKMLYIEWRSSFPALR
jgi:hypothetical protein